MITRLSVRKTKIMNTVKNFKEETALHSHEITEKSLKIIEKAIKFHKNSANDEN